MRCISCASALGIPWRNMQEWRITLPGMLFRAGDSDSVVGEKSGARLCMSERGAGISVK